MKKNVVFLSLAFLALNLSARTPAGGMDPGPAIFGKASTVTKVSALIEAKFKSQYGPLVNVSWKVIEDISIATFTEEGAERDVFYYSDGETFGFGKQIDKGLMPKAVAESLSKRFKGGLIQAVYEFKTSDFPTRYYVRLIAPNYLVIASATEFGDITVYQKEKAR